MYLCIGKVGTVWKKKKRKVNYEIQEKLLTKRILKAAQQTAEQFDLQGLLLSQFHYSSHFNKYYEILLQKL